jgi:two-component system OmpR family response regulator
MRLMLTKGLLLPASSLHFLQAAGFGVDCFDDPDDATEALLIATYDLALLECSTSFDWSAWLKRFGKPANTSYIMLTARNEEQRLAAFEAGADDCLGHGLSGRELVARAHALLRRPRTRLDQVLQTGNLWVDCTNREVTVDGGPVAVPPQELRIMELVMRKPGRVVTRSLLESDLYGACMQVGPNSIEARISCLRRRLAAAGADVTVQNVRGVGYKLAQVPHRGRTVEQREGASL